jgi:hypothetical protein
MIPCTKLFVNKCQIVELANIIFVAEKCIIFPVRFGGQVVLSKDPTVWIGGARPASACIPPSFLGKCLHSCGAFPTSVKHLLV